MPTPLSVDAIPVLVELNRRASQAKRLTATGVKPADKTMWFQQEPLSAQTLAELYKAVDCLRARPEASVNRWEFRPDLDPSLGWPRRKRTMIEQPRRWLMIDVDSLEAPGLDFAREPELGAAFARLKLPDEFHDAACVWHASGSAGSKSGIRVHLWFLLDEVVAGGQCRYWLRDSPVDLALYNSTQPHYTADPILERGVTDPMSARIGRLDGTERVRVPQRVLEFVPAPAQDPVDVEHLDLDVKTRREAVRAAEHIVAAQVRKVRRLGPNDLWDNTLNSACYVCGQMAWLVDGGVQQVREDLSEAVESLGDPTFDDRAAEKIERVVAEGASCPALPDGIEVPGPVVHRPPIEFITGPDLAAKQPPRKWVCQPLGIGPGRPTLFAGYGASCKTFAAQALALAVASRTSIWGKFAATGGNVVHIDAEMGRYSIVERYQRLARGAELKPEQWQTLRIASHAGVRLDDKSSEDRLDEIVETTSADVVILDSLRALTPSLDENHSEIRNALDLLARLSDKHDCTFIVIHHAGKSERGDARQVARGSSAIFDAADCVIQFDAGANGKVRVSQTKSPLRNFVPFTIELQDAHDVLDDALRLSVVDDTNVARDRSAADKNKICAFVREHPGCSQAKIRADVGLKSTRVKDLLEVLCEDGRILNTGTKQSGSYSIDPSHGDEFDEPEEVTQVRPLTRKNAS